MNKEHTVDWPILPGTLSFATWNPWTGCKNNCNLKDDGYDCYARKLHNERHKAYLEGKRLPIQYAKPFNEIQVFQQRFMDKDLYRPEPMTIFVGSMTDIFSDGVVPMDIYQLIHAMEYHKQHTFMLLTKKPENYVKYEWPLNCMLGTTVELVSEKTIQRMEDLLEMRNDQFLSIEPILGSFEEIDLVFLDLIIIGADGRPEKSWIESVLASVNRDKNDIPKVWFKKNLRKFYPEFKNPTA